MADPQLSLPFYQDVSAEAQADDQIEFGETDFDFHSQDSAYASHNFHSFPAKFPPQLPRYFIESLTNPGDMVLDPMQGSGTTVLEAILNGRNALGTDIDPLAALITSVKTAPLDPIQVLETSREIMHNARTAYSNKVDLLSRVLKKRWDSATKEFIDYWFDRDTQLALLALILEIERIEHVDLRKLFQLTFSAIIITKTGGVSLALDLAHTRPHRAKLIYKRDGEILEGAQYLDNPIKHLGYATKKLRSPFQEFDRKIQANLGGILNSKDGYPKAKISFGNAENLPIQANSIDLIVTSPPYASNAIDYMRAHKFSLVWFGYSTSYLSKKRGTYIGGEMLSGIVYENLPEFTTGIVDEISALNIKKGQVLARYYSEMSRVLREMHRVLKPGKSAVMVVGNSVLQGCSTQTQLCLADIGKAIGFSAPQIMIRNIDRNRRMMPAGKIIDETSQIQQRMHEEHILVFNK